MDNEDNQIIVSPGSLTENKHTGKVNLENEEAPPDKSEVPFWTSCRVYLCAMNTMGFFVFYLLRINISVAIICMVIPDNDTKGDNDDEWCGDVAEDGHSGSFEWSRQMQGAILSSFFVGYLFTQIWGGWLAERVGGKHVYGVGLGIGIITTLLTPLAAYATPILVIILRIIHGLANGVGFPASHCIWGRWAPPLERSKLIGFSYAGIVLGTILALAGSGPLCGTSGGWPLIFYVYGGISAVWLILWTFTTYSSPEHHPRIGKKEKDYIMKNIGESVYDGKQDTPWKTISSSGPVWAIIIAHATSNWGNYTVLTCIPLYFEDVLQFDVSTSGAAVAIPYVTGYIVAVFVGWLADFLQERNILGPTGVRKWFQGTAFILPAGLMIAMGFFTCETRVWAVFVLTLLIVFTSASRAGYLVNHVDIATKYAGTLFGISNTLATVPGILAPLAVGALTTNGTREEWQIVFYICTGLYLVGFVVYQVFASGELQEWGGVDEPNSVQQPKWAKTEKSDSGIQNIAFTLFAQDNPIHG